MNRGLATLQNALFISPGTKILHDLCAFYVSFLTSSTHTRVSRSRLLHRARNLGTYAAARVSEFAAGRSTGRLSAGMSVLGTGLSISPDTKTLRDLCAFAFLSLRAQRARE